MKQFATEVVSALTLLWSPTASQNATPIKTCTVVLRPYHQTYETLRQYVQKADATVHEFKANITQATDDTTVMIDDELLTEYNEPSEEGHNDSELVIMKKNIKRIMVRMQSLTLDDGSIFNEAIDISHIDQTPESLVDNAFDEYTGLRRILLYRQMLTSSTFNTLRISINTLRMSIKSFLPHITENNYQAFKEMLKILKKEFFQAEGEVMRYYNPAPLNPFIVMADIDRIAPAIRNFQERLTRLKIPSEKRDEFDQAIKAYIFILQHSIFPNKASLHQECEKLHRILAITYTQDT